MRRTLALLLTVVLAAGLCGGQEKVSLQDQMRAIAANSPIEVRFQDGSKLRGWISDVSDSGFVLKHETRHQLQDSQFPFDSVRSVKAVKSVHPSHTTSQHSHRGWNRCGSDRCSACRGYRKGSANRLLTQGRGHSACAVPR